MTNRKWYTPSGITLRIVRRVTLATKRVEIVLAGCTLYGIIDIYGVVNVPALATWAYKELQKRKGATNGGQKS